MKENPQNNENDDGKTHDPESAIELVRYADDRESVCRIISALKDVVAPEGLRAMIKELLNYNARCDFWALEAVAEAFTEIKQKYVLSQSQSTELVLLLWNERAIVPGEELEMEVIGLCTQNVMLMEALEAYNESFCAKLNKGF